MKSAQITPPQDWDRTGLPAWSFFNEEMLSLEKEVLFRSHWQAKMATCGHFTTCVGIVDRASSPRRAAPASRLSFVRFTAGPIIWTEPCAGRRSLRPYQSWTP
jgi:hypothetical protein